MTYAPKPYVPPNPRPRKKKMLTDVARVVKTLERDVAVAMSCPRPTVWDQGIYTIYLKSALAEMRSLAKLPEENFFLMDQKERA
jgi:hypothetical protein